MCQALDINTVPPCSHAEHVGLVSGHSHCLHDISLVFLSTYPVRGTTPFFDDFVGFGLISIHVPRAGYDKPEKPKKPWVFNFYPRTPCGVRRGAPRIVQAHRAISIHVPRAGYDSTSSSASAYPQYFYPRTPCGVRRARTMYDEGRSTFLSTYPVRGTTTT